MILELNEEGSRGLQSVNVRCISGREMIYFNTSTIFACGGMLAISPRLSDRVLTEAVCNEVIGGTLERTTGELLRQVTLRDFCAYWLTGKTTAKSEGTSTRYQGSVRRFLSWLGEKTDRPVKAISPRDCQGFHDYPQAEKLPPASVAVEIKTIRSVFNAPRRLGLITVNPAAAVEQQRETAAPVCSENPSLLHCGPMSLGCVRFRWSLFHPAILPRRPHST